MFNTLHFFLATLFWLLSKIPPTWTSFISTGLNIQIIIKKNLSRCGSNRLSLFCNLIGEAQQGSVANYGPESHLGWVQDGCRGRILQMLPNVNAPDHVRFLGVFRFRVGQCWTGWTEEPSLNCFRSLKEWNDSHFCSQAFVVLLCSQIKESRFNIETNLFKLFNLMYYCRWGAPHQVTSASWFEFEVETCWFL